MQVELRPGGELIFLKERELKPDLLDKVIDFWQNHQAVDKIQGWLIAAVAYPSWAVKSGFGYQEVV